MDIDWSNLKFEFLPTKSNIRFTCHNNRWDEGKLYNTYDITMSVAANCLHYGQAIFEGMKAFRCKDGKVRVFRPQENAERMRRSAARIMMADFPAEMFLDGVRRVVRDNLEYIPPYGTGGSLYIRPVMFGTTAQIGVNSSVDYTLVIMVVPVGAYYKGGITPVDAMVSDFDRAAPRGTGTIKCAGNYAASLYPGKLAKEAHCPVALFLDPKEREYIDEFGTSNFLAVTKAGQYVTPESESILPSVTNKSLFAIAGDLGMNPVQRPIHVGELADMAEVAACGTAVVLTPVRRIYYGDKVFSYGETIGPKLKALYDHMTGIQYGELPDTRNWLMDI
ncbi:MAG: branched-chain amino acid aminotransferase [Victivallaceae bacterium]|nr:branched-chain amino acid aminotransferase [Victivallaceae bacterium]